MAHNHQQASSAIFCDLQNVSSIVKRANLLLDLAKSKGRLDCQRVYYNSQCTNQVSAKDVLSGFGFEGVDVPCPCKDSADNKLKSDLIDHIYNNQSSDIFILVSGDGDFVNSVRFLKDRGKRVIIIAQRGNVKQRLKELADEFYFVEELPQLVGKSPQCQNNSVGFQINYNEAIDYLIDAIKTASNQGKRTALGYINKLMNELMSQRFPNYKGVSSIRTPDGKKFSRFGKFVDAVVKDGKVRRQNQELFLIELNTLPV